MRIAEYWIIYDDLEGVISRANASDADGESIANGWQPLGGPTYCGAGRDGEAYFAQAMVRYEPQAALDAAEGE